MPQSDSIAPRHLAIILDGNRRYAKQRGMPQLLGHQQGYENTKNFLTWCKELNIPEITLYAFSMENFNRSKEEVDYLMKLFQKAFTSLQKDPNVKNVKINFIGRTHLFPKGVQDAIQKLMESTKNNKPHTINFALGYGGRTEIVDATKKIAEDVKKGTLQPDQITEDMLEKNLYLPTNVDLIIRPGGEQRTSNFLTWQSTYAEWIFLEKMWPEFTKEDLIACINEYHQRERRFGK